MKLSLLPLCFFALLLAKQSSAQNGAKKTPLKASGNQSIQSINIEPGQSPGDVGKVTFSYQGKKVAYSTVRAKDGNIWLQQNLGSQAVATKLQDEKAFGDLFQWGRWDDGHQLVVSPAHTRRMTAEPNNPDALDKSGPNPFYYDLSGQWWSDGSSKDSWTAATPKEATSINGCDPCKAIGAGWHLPTKEEAENAWKLEYVTDENGALLSNLKLVYTGERMTFNGDASDQGSFKGKYWTSTPSKKQAFCLYFYPEAMAYERGAGLSIRCLKAANYIVPKATAGKTSKVEASVTNTDYLYHFDRIKNTYTPLANTKANISIEKTGTILNSRQFKLFVYAIDEFSSIMQSDSLAFYMKPKATHSVTLYKLEMESGSWAVVALGQKFGQQNATAVNNINITITPAAEGIYKVSVPQRLPKGNYCLVTTWDIPNKSAEVFPFLIH